MKILLPMIAGALAAAMGPAMDHAAMAQNMPQTSSPPDSSPAAPPPPADAAPTEAPAGQMVKPLVGDILYDKNGEEIGTVSTSNEQQVVVTTTRGKITIPVSSLFAGQKGLAINMSKEEVDAAVHSSH